MVNYQIGSIKRSVTQLVILITTLLVAVASVTLSLMYVRDIDQNLRQDTRNLVAYVERNVTPTLVFAQAEQADTWLTSLTYLPLVQHVHVYKFEPISESLTFFASFYAEQSSPIPVRYDRAQELSQPVRSERYYEFAKPILLDGKLLGYVYLRSSRSELDHAIALTTGLTLAAISAGFALSWTLSLWLRRRITQPLDSMVADINAIARNRDYSSKLAEVQLAELDQVSHAFNSLLERIQQHIEKQDIAEQRASELNKELERQVEVRTQQLRAANQDLTDVVDELHQYQHEIVEARKMQSLGRLISGISHEMNTPVGLAVTSSSILQDKLEALATKFNEKKLTSDDMQRFLTSFTENLELVTRNLGRTADIVNAFQQLGLEQYSDSERAITLGSFSQDILQQLHSRYPELDRVHIVIDVSAQLTVRCLAGPLASVISQLFQNSAQHAFHTVENPHIHLHFSFVSDNSSSNHSGRLLIHYRDNGEGIPESISGHIFEPFVTSKRGQGATGLGMHLVYNLVHQVLKGTIEIDPIANHGAAFRISIPVELVAN